MRHVVLGCPAECDGKSPRLHPDILKGLPQSYAERRGILFTGLGKQKDELVASYAGDNLVLPAGSAEHVRHGAQQAVPRLMAERVVRQLEPVDVHKEERQRHISRSVQARKLFVEEAPVVQPGEVVVKAEVLNLLLLLFQLGDVDVRPDHPDGIAVRVGLDAPSPPADPHPRAVLPAKAELHVERGRLSGEIRLKSAIA